jgi:arylsulfatase A-like enzyme
MKTLICLSVLLCLVAGSLHRGSRPNMVILFVDDWGWGDLGENCLHAAEVPGAKAGQIDKETACSTNDGSTITPRMDSLAKGGMRFTDFHAAAAVCGPSRAGLQTGRMGARSGVTGNFGPGSLHGLPSGELTMAELLNGTYHTLAIGYGEGTDRKLYLMLICAFISQEMASRREEGLQSHRSWVR